MILYFFKDRSKERLDFFQLVDEYFDKLENTMITSDDDEVTITFKLPNFNCSYKYLITKRSRVSCVYRLNPNYVNTFLLCDIPDDVPFFVHRIMLKQVAELCRNFEFAIYHDKIDNITEFNMFELIAILNKEKAKFLDEHSEIKKYPVNQDMLNDICTYQSLINELPNIVNDDIIVNPYIVLKDSENKIYFSTNWNVGLPTTFPPHLDFVHVIEEENLVSLVPIQVFNKYVQRLTYEVHDGTIGIEIRYLNESNSQRARRVLRKMRKSAVSTHAFDIIKLTDLIEK